MRKAIALQTGTGLVAKGVGLLRAIVVAYFLGSSVLLDGLNGALVIAGATVFIVADQLEIYASSEAALAAGDRPAQFGEYAGRALGAGLTIGISLALPAYLLVTELTPRLVPAVSGLSPAAMVWLSIALLPVFALRIPSRIAAALLRAGGLLNEAIVLDAAQGAIFLLVAVPMLAAMRKPYSLEGVAALAIAQSAALTTVFAAQFILLRARCRLAALELFRMRQAVGLIFRAGDVTILNTLIYGFTLIDRHYAAIAVAGGLTLVNYAGSISQALRSALGYENIFVVHFAGATRRADAYARSVRVCMVVSIPLMVLLPEYAVAVMTAVYHRGQFTTSMVTGSARVLVFYGAFTAGFLLWQMLFRILQMEGCLSALYIPALAGLLLSLIITPMASAHFGLAGAVCGTIAGTCVMIAAALRALAKRGFQLLSGRSLTRLLLYFIYCVAVVAGAKMLGARSVHPTAIGGLAEAAAAGAACYLPCLLWLNTRGLRPRMMAA